MKKERLAALMMAGIMSVSCAGIAMAATGTKTATLNNAKVRFNNGAVQTIQCYNIDGSNYVRARDITNNLNMGVAPVLNGTNGVMVHPYKTATKTTPATLTKQSAVVKLVDGKISYNGSPYMTECFLLDGSYFFKVADFEKASENNLGHLTELVTVQANGTVADKPTCDEISHVISVEWNAAEKVMEISRSEVDMVAMFKEIRGVDTTAAAVVETPKTKPPVVATGVLTSAPEVGEILANILIDESEGAYKADGSVNSSNYQTAYTLFSNSLTGQCTWYAHGRFVEVYGEEIARNNPFQYGSTVSKWIENANSSECPDLESTTNANMIKAGCIAVYDGHVLFVEYVEYDSNGDPETVYFTEANTQHNGKYYPSKDAKVQKLSFNKFINRQPFIGYVMVK